MMNTVYNILVEDRLQIASTYVFVGVGASYESIAFMICTI